VSCASTTQSSARAAFIYEIQCKLAKLALLKCRFTIHLARYGSSNDSTTCCKHYDRLMAIKSKVQVPAQKPSPNTMDDSITLNHGSSQKQHADAIIPNFDGLYRYPSADELIVNAAA